MSSNKFNGFYRVYFFKDLTNSIYKITLFPVGIGYPNFFLINYCRYKDFMI